MSHVSPVLEVRELCAGYGTVEALHHVGLVVGAGQIVTVIGANGAGKTTLLAAIMGLLKRTRGEMFYAGADESESELERMVSLGMILVPEKRELFGTMTVADNLLLGWYARYCQGHRDEAESLIEEVFGIFPRLRERRLQAAGTLSGGERQMLALGRALMGKPKLLMLDEPSLGLAPLIVREIFAVIGELRQKGVSILLVEQNAKAALQLADYAYVLETGEVAMEGCANELASDPKMIASYLGLVGRH
jgi:branched-chain amino acid transport system ATP-binding protein